MNTSAIIVFLLIDFTQIFLSTHISNLSDQLADDKSKREDWVGSLPKSVESAQKLVPSIARLVSLFIQAARTTVLDQFRRVQEIVGSAPAAGSDPETSSTLLNSLCIVGSRCQATENLAQEMTCCLPPGLKTALAAWAATPLLPFPPPCGWKNQFDKDCIPGESYIFSTILAHTGLLSAPVPAASLKHALSRNTTTL